MILSGLLEMSAALRTSWGVATDTYRIRDPSLTFSISLRFSMSSSSLDRSSQVPLARTSR